MKTAVQRDAAIAAALAAFSTGLIAAALAGYSTTAGVNGLITTALADCLPRQLFEVVRGGEI